MTQSRKQEDMLHTENSATEEKANKVRFLSRIIVVFVLPLFLLLFCSLKPGISYAVTIKTEKEINARLDELKKLEGLYFTTDGKKCGDQDARCMIRNVIAEDSKFRSNSKLTKWPADPKTFYVNHGLYNASSNTTSLTAKNYSCRAFANFAGWYLFSDQPTDEVEYYRLIECKRKEVYLYAKPGDIIASSGHSLIFLYGSEKSITGLDCNRGHDCKIQISTFNKSMNTMVTINRAMNYAQRTDYILISKKTENGHEYRLYGGYCSWKEAKKYAESLGEGWSLATITSAEEQEVIASMASTWNSYDRGGMAWLGGMKDSSGWHWVTGEAFTYTNWINTKQTKEYLCIYGHTNSSFKTTADKWGARSSLEPMFMTGFVAECSHAESGAEEETYHYTEEYEVLYTKGVRLREGPGTGYNIMSVMNKGDHLLVDTSVQVSGNGYTWSPAVLMNGDRTKGWAAVSETDLFRKVAKVTNTPGDVNEDGVVDGRDTVRLMKFMAGEIDPETGLVYKIHEDNADVTGDGTVDAKDLLRLTKYLGGERVNLEKGKVSAR